MNRGISGRLLAFGTTGVCASIALLMVLLPVGAGSVPHPGLVLKAPYARSTSSPSSSTNVGGCAGTSTTTGTWNAHTGIARLADSAKAASCKGVSGGLGSFSYGYVTNSITIVIPFTVLTNGAHSISQSWTVTLASARGYTSGGCPAKLVNTNPPSGTTSVGYCEDGAEWSFNSNAYLVDLTNGSWASYNASSVAAYDLNGWQNYTLCTNPASPPCTTTVGPIPFTANFQVNAAGFSGWVWNGATSFTMWSNGTNMVRGHHYVLVVTVSDDKLAFVYQYNLAKTWIASAFSSINMATGANGAKLNSVTII
jgi:hypothetical protein